MDTGINLQTSPGSNTDADLILEFIARMGIDAEDIRKYPLQERAIVLHDQLLLDEEVTIYTEFVQSMPYLNLSDRGIALIKPELSQQQDIVVKFLSNLGCKPCILPKQFLSHDQWMAIYGNRIKDCPEIMFLYVTQRALGLIPVLFDFLQLEDYLKRDIDVRALPVTDSNDLAEVFNHLYCGHVYEETPGTIRWEIVRPALLASGFSHMDDYALAFDPFHYFRHRPATVNFRFFNGIHLPDNYEECASNMNTLFGKKIAEQSLEKQ